MMKSLLTSLGIVGGAFVIFILLIGSLLAPPAASSVIEAAITPARVPAANKQGNTNVFQLAGSITNGNCMQADANGNTSTTSSTCGTRTAAVTDITPVTTDSGLILLVDPASAISLTRLYCASQAGTNVVVNLDKRTESTIGTDSGAHLLGGDLTAVNTGANTSTFSNGSGQCGGTSSCAIAAHNPVVVTITSISGSVNALNCSLEYTVQ